ncbi:hypothetical protein JTA33_11500 [Pseudomonas sp. 20GA0080]|uniref:hypothetical protein n=1 Tax=Pseudomonas alliivorans TaxID=2810613 RepID=UPI001AE775B2|nr:hypothetical protein [Pseudomonas alliivorans]MBP0951071.1 hypothetical protein [Pseudomonas alliivorans]MEE4664512.1 hypothetical protein [Pseudomonas alliivorans]
MAEKIEPLPEKGPRRALFDMEVFTEIKNLAYSLGLRENMSKDLWLSSSRVAVCFRPTLLKKSASNSTPEKYAPEMKI